MNTSLEVKIVLSSKTVLGGGMFDVHMVNILIINMYLMDLYEEENYGFDPSLREHSIKSLLARYTL